MPTINNRQLSSQQVPTCQTNVTGYTQFTVQAANGAVQQYALLAKDHISKAAGHGMFEGSYVPAYKNVAEDLVQACEAPTQTNATAGCSIGIERPCPPPVACQFNSANFATLGAPLALGTGSIQLGRLINDVPAGSAFETCVQNSLPSVVAEDLAHYPIQSSSASTTAGSSKKLIVTAALFATAMAVIQRA